MSEYRGAMARPPQLIRNSMGAKADATGKPAGFSGIKLPKSAT